MTVYGSAVAKVPIPLGPLVSVQALPVVRVKRRPGSSPMFVAVDAWSPVVHRD